MKLHLDLHSLYLAQQELHRRYEGTPESTKTKALQTVIDMKVRIEKEKCVLVCVCFSTPMCHATCVNSTLSTPGCKNQFNGQEPERHGRGAANAEVQWTPEL